MFIFKQNGENCPQAVDMNISPLEKAPNDMRLIHVFYESFTAKKMNRDEFIRKLRSVVGDQILRSAIYVLQTKMKMRFRTPKAKGARGMCRIRAAQERGFKICAKFCMW
nr:inactive poly [ADP-ribose] polymerase RCD1-like isoform X1 [Tanacetum cinerariifolium]